MEPVHDSRTPALRLPASDRRLQLVETALDFFSRKGFSGTTTKEIPAAAGVTGAASRQLQQMTVDFFDRALK